MKHLVTTCGTAERFEETIGMPVRLEERIDSDV